jgi:hypothetical protein
MTWSIRRLGSLAVLLTVLARCGAADEPLTRVQIARIGKASTALVEVKAQRGQSYASAFCIHPSGWFLTNAHVAQGEITLVLNPSLTTERAYKARVVRSDTELDLALLRADGARDLPALSLGSDEGLEELMDVVAFGFPLAGSQAPGRDGRPAISVNAGSVTALRRQEGRLKEIQLDAELNPGNSGGPVLDGRGKVIGVVRSGVVARGLGRTGMNPAIPVSAVYRFVARPEVQFDPPRLKPGDMHQPVRFEARVTPLLPSTAPLSVDLILKTGNGPERIARMEADGDRYGLSAVPIPGRSGPLTLRVIARFEDGSLDTTTTDRTFTAGGREVALADVRTIWPGSPARVSLRDGTMITAGLFGLDAVPMPVGPKTLSVRLDRAKVVEVTPVGGDERVACTLVVRQGGKEIYQQSRAVGDAGLLKNPDFEDGLKGWTHFSTDGAQTQFDLDTNVVREGRQSLRIAAPRPSDSGCYQDLMLKAGHQYRFSGWLRTRGLDPHGAGAYGTFDIQRLGANWGGIAHGTYYRGDTEWTQVALTFQAPPDGLTRICAVFAIFGQGTGTAWFDDLNLEEISPAGESAPSVSAVTQPDGSGLAPGAGARGGHRPGPAVTQPNGTGLASAPRWTRPATALLAVLPLIMFFYARRRQWWGPFGSRRKRVAMGASAATVHPDAGAHA